MKGPSRLVKAQRASPLLLCRTLALVVLLGPRIDDIPGRGVKFRVAKVHNPDHRA